MIKYKCTHESHKRFQTGLHVLICEQHKDRNENKVLLENYRAKYIANPGSPYRDYSKTIALHADAESDESYIAHGEDLDVAIYMLQTISVDGKKLNLFYDTGCSDMVCKKEAVDCLSKAGRAKNILRGPLTISGVGDKKSICDHGKYQIPLPLVSGKNVNLSGICIDKITGIFPPYPLSDVERDIHQAFTNKGGDIR